MTVEKDGEQELVVPGLWCPTDGCPAAEGFCMSGLGHVMSRVKC